MRSRSQHQTPDLYSCWLDHAEQPPAPALLVGPYYARIKSAVVHVDKGATAHFMCDVLETLHMEAAPDKDGMYTLWKCLRIDIISENQLNDPDSEQTTMGPPMTYEEVTRAMTVIPAEWERDGFVKDTLTPEERPGMGSRYIGPQPS